MSLFLFGCLLIAGGKWYLWKQRALSQVCVTPETATTPSVPSYRIKYKEGRAIKTMTVEANSEDEAMRAAAKKGCRFDVILEMVKL